MNTSQFLPLPSLLFAIVGSLVSDLLFLFCFK